jgi:anti-sigma B factor antagonist
MTEQSFDLAEDRTGEMPVIAITGEVDLATAPLLRERLDAHLDGGASSIIVDLRGTTFLDSTGLGVLVNVLKRCREAGGELHLVISEPRILKLFAITGLQETFPISPSLDAVAEGGPHSGPP